MSAPHETENQFLAAVLEYAALQGWRCFHARPARTEKGWRTAGQGNGAKGFPDLVMARNGAVIFAELKSARGHLSASQRRWMVELPQVYIWRPQDWDEIEQLLR